MTDVAELRLEVSSDPRLLGLIRGVLQVWLGIVKIDAERRAEVVLAVDEACSNAIRHAYGGRTDGRVELVLASSDEWIEITVSDEGTPCPPERTEYRPPAPTSANDIQPGGLGVRLMYEIFDELRFCPGSPRGNCVTMRLLRNTERGVKRGD